MSNNRKYRVDYRVTRKGTQIFESNSMTRTNEFIAIIREDRKVRNINLAIRNADGTYDYA